MEPLLTTKQASELLGVHPDFIRQRLKKIPHYKFPNAQPKFKASELTAWIAGYKVATHTDKTNP